MGRAKDFVGNADKNAKVARRDWQKDAKFDIYIESYGVKIRISTDAREAFQTIEKILRAILPGCFQIIEKTDVEHHFTLFWGADGKDSLYLNEKEVPSNHTRTDVLRGFETQLRLTVAEYAPERVFMHAGVVAWKDLAIVIPARSFQGKTSLVAALVRRGAVYYSDEYAIFDREGYVYPFPKTLSIRGEIDEFTQKEYPVEAFGGIAGEKKIPVGMILISGFKADAEWNPQILSAGQGILEILEHVVPIRFNPKFSIKVLNQVANRAIIAKTLRGDVSKSVDLILDFFESECIKI
ncbi:MAG TPA: hypothetical protein VF599_06570 [Pyrinomonadaceae bacterium]|jgi:hypothetical protein